MFQIGLSHPLRRSAALSRFPWDPSTRRGRATQRSRPSPATGHAEQTLSRRNAVSTGQRSRRRRSVPGIVVRWTQKQTVHLACVPPDGSTSVCTIRPTERRGRRRGSVPSSRRRALSDLAEGDPSDEQGLRSSLTCVRRRHSAARREAGQRPDSTNSRPARRRDLEEGLVRIVARATSTARSRWPFERRVAPRLRTYWIDLGLGSKLERRSTS